MPEIKTPAITVTAIGTGRKITLNKIGTPALFIFHGRNTAEASRDINGPVRDRFPEASKLLIATVMDLHATPRLLRGVVEAFIRDAFEDAIKELPKGWTAREYLLLLPDWDGSLTKNFGIKDPDKVVGLAVLDRQAKVVGVYQGKDFVNQALALLDKVKSEIG
jgi:hypothetical protein